MAEVEKSDKETYGGDKPEEVESDVATNEGDGFMYNRNLPEPSTTDIDAGKSDALEQPRSTNETDRGAPVVGPPHHQALVDIWRILPCQVQPVNTTDWYTVVGVKTEKNGGEFILITDKDEELREREIGNPVLVRTTDASGTYLH